MPNSNSPKILIVGEAVSSPRNLIRMRSEFNIERVSSSTFLNSPVQYLRRFKVIWIHVDSALDEQLEKEFSREHVLATTSTGSTHIPRKIIEKLGQRFISLKGQNSLLETITSTAELAWAMTLVGLTGLIEASQDVQRGFWRRLENCRELQVSSSRIGIIGYGRLGRMYGKFAKQMTNEILVWDIDEDRRVEAEKNGCTVTKDLASLVNCVDALSLHVNVELGVPPLIDTNLVSCFQNGMTLVNTSRGIVVDERAIIAGLETGKISQYFGDVLEAEDTNSPITESEIWKASQRDSRIVLTPHIGGASRDAIEQCELSILSQIRNIIST